MKLSGVLGQNKAQRQLEAELAADRLAHAYLFVGPAGVGRSTMARALFAAANCENPTGEYACGICGSCRRLASGNHEDFLILEPPHDSPSAQIKVEQVREVIHAMSFAPFAGGWRMVLIRMAGHLNQASSGALLKILEEPPPKNMMVLTVQDPAEVLPTLVSRCRRVNFAPLSPEIVAAELEKRGADPDSARLKAAMSAGSLGRALELDENSLAGELDGLVKHLASPGGPQKDWAFAESLISRHRGGERIDRQAIAGGLDLWCQYFRDRAVTQGSRPGAVFLGREGGPPLTLVQAVEAFARVRRAQSEILSNAAPELCLAVLLGRLRSLASAGASPGASR